MRFRVCLLFVFAFIAFSPAAAHATERAECLAASDLGQDLRQSHKLVEAREQFIKCAQSGCPAVVAQDCAQWVKDVETAIPTLTIAARDRAGKDLIAVTVLLDGKLWLTALDGQARPLNPGPHRLTFQSTDGSSTEDVLVREGEHDRAITITLGEEHSPTLPTAVIAPIPRAVVATPEHASATWIKPTGITVGLTGVGALVVAAIFAGVATSDWHEALNECNGSCLPGSAAYTTKGTSVALADWSTALFVGGGVFAATGIFMFVIAPRKPNRLEAHVGLGHFDFLAHF